MIRNPSRALALAAGLVIIALTAAAFWLSYAHLAEVALAHGMRDKEVRAWAWPATLDLFIVAGELLMLRAALKGSVDGWAIGLTVAGSGGSIALNVAGVGSAAELLDYVVAAVPPTAALLAFGALMRQIHQALAERANRRDIPTVEADKLSASTQPSVTASRGDIATTDDLHGADDRAGESEADATEAQKATVAEERPELPPVTRPPVVPDGARMLPLVARPEPVEADTPDPLTEPDVHRPEVPTVTPLKVTESEDLATSAGLPAKKAAALVICGDRRVWHPEFPSRDEDDEVSVAMADRLPTEAAANVIRAAWVLGTSVTETARQATRSTSYVKKVFARLDEERQAADLKFLSDGQASSVALVPAVRS